jgi:glycosyltransferase involved in cell wall biosynthesis
MMVVAGDDRDAYAQSLKRLADALNLTKRVVWAGHIELAMKASAFADAEVFVLPSFSENFGIAAAEALMAGVPCVLGAGVAIAAAIEEAGAGFAVAPEPDAIAGAITRLLSDPALRRQMASRAGELARRKYSIEAMGSGLVDMYTRIAR